MRITAVVQTLALFDLTEDDNVLRARELWLPAQLYNILASSKLFTLTKEKLRTPPPLAKCNENHTETCNGGERREQKKKKTV